MLDLLIIIVAGFFWGWTGALVAAIVLIVVGFIALALD